MTTIRDDVLTLVAAMAPDAAGTPELTSALINDLGYTSMRLLELTIAVEQAFGLEPFTPEDLAGVTTVGDLVELVERQGAPS